MNIHKKIFVFFCAGIFFFFISITRGTITVKPVFNGNPWDRKKVAVV